MLPFLRSVPRRLVFALGGGILGAAVLFSCIIVTLGPPRTELSEMSRVFRAFRPVEPAASQTIGGDLTLEPPVQPVKAPALPVLKGEMLASDALTAESVVVKDETSGIVLFRKFEYKRHPIASMTKLMSALVIIERDLDWSSRATVVEDAVNDTHMYAGDTYTLEELWQTGLIGSSNKAILTLVDATGMTREAFALRMNEKAREIGLLDATFVEPTGLDQENKASAADMALLLEEALRSEKIQTTLMTPEYTIYSAERKKKHHLWNTNWLLLGWIPHPFQEIRGWKTGYIPAAGYNFATQVVGDKGQVLDVVVLGAPTNEARFTEAKAAAEWVLREYEWPE